MRLNTFTVLSLFHLCENEMAVTVTAIDTMACRISLDSVIIELQVG